MQMSIFLSSFLRVGAQKALCVLSWPALFQFKMVVLFTGCRVDFNILRASYESDLGPEATSTALIEEGFFLLVCSGC